ncbi:hypothetical protein OG301_38890 (plasmid) [Streptomyces platensis]|uniref:hypothetical protein n=1 Tax=Streptomyces platensis TaxID=58346 RepID=UPI002ED20744|nr:hypothetical protein OG301_38890 [Streptomyces platensis]
MTDPIVSVEELYALPSASVPPHSAREEIAAAAKILRARDNWATDTLMWWLVDTAMLHAPDANGDCDRDHDRWPCNDITAARKVAETIHIIGTEPLGDVL